LLSQHANVNLDQLDDRVVLIIVGLCINDCIQRYFFTLNRGLYQCVKYERLG